MSHFSPTTCGSQRGPRDPSQSGLVASAFNCRAFSQPRIYFSRVYLDSIFYFEASLHHLESLFLRSFLRDFKAPSQGAYGVIYLCPRQNWQTESLRFWKWESAGALQEDLTGPRGSGEASSGEQHPAVGSELWRLHNSLSEFLGPLGIFHSPKQLSPSFRGEGGVEENWYALDNNNCGTLSHSKFEFYNFSRQ